MEANIQRFLSGELSETEFETAVLNDSDWDGNKPADKYWILLEAYREAFRSISRPVKA